MNERLSQALGKAKGAWDSLSRGRRIAVLGSAALFVALLSFLIYSTGANKNFGVLYSGLQPVDAAAVLQYLQEQQIPYRVSDSGEDFWIPQDRISETRLELAARGFPSSGVVGLEILDDLPLGLTEAQWMERYLRGVAGELARNIQWIDAVESARVLITPERTSLYRSQREPARAAITLKLRPGRSLTPAQVKAIIQLAVSSVQGLTEEWVSIVDQYGNLLSDMVSTHMPLGGDAISQRLALTREYEATIERAIQRQLGALLGHSAVVAQVRAELNFDFIREESEIFSSPTGGSLGIPRSEQFISERYSGGLFPTGGPAGVVSNIPGYPEGGAFEGGEYDYREEIINYELNRTVMVRETIPGSVERLSVAVLIDGELDAVTLDELTRQVAAIAGAVEGRDVVEVYSMPFAPPPPDVTAVVARPQTAYELPPSWWWIAAAGLVLLLVIVLFSRRPQPVAAPSKVEQGEEEEIQLWTSPELTPAERRKLGIRKELEAFADQRPQDVARLLRGWLTED